MLTQYLHTCGNCDIYIKVNVVQNTKESTNLLSISFGCFFSTDRSIRSFRRIFRILFNQISIRSRDKLKILTHPMNLSEGSTNLVRHKTGKEGGGRKYFGHSLHASINKWGVVTGLKKQRKGRINHTEWHLFCRGEVAQQNTLSMATKFKQQTQVKEKWKCNRNQYQTTW